MKINFLILIIGFVVGLNTAAQNPIGVWETHLPYHVGNSLTLRDHSLLVASENSYFFSYDLEYGSIATYTNVDGYSSINCQIIRYDEVTGVTLMLYANGDIDLAQNGNIHNLSGLRNNLTYFDKTVNEIIFINGNAWLATNFGVVIIDMLSNEFKEDFTIGQNGDIIKVYDITTDGTSMYAATEYGLFMSSFDNPNLDNYLGWTLIETPPALYDYAQCLYHNGNLYFSDNTNLYKKKTDGSFELIYSTDIGHKITRIDPSLERLLLLEYEFNASDEIVNAQIALVDSLGQAIKYHEDYVNRPKETYTAPTGEIYVADFWSGLLKLVDGVMQDRIVPMSIPTINARQLIAYDDRVFIAPGGAKLNWGDIGGPGGEGLIYRADNIWKQKTAGEPGLQNIERLACCAFDPVINKAYFGSYGRGLVELSNDVATHYYDDFGLQSHIDDPASFRVTGLAFDQDHNLWVSSYGANKPLSVITPEGNFAVFDNPISLPSTNVNSMVIDDEGNKWVLIAKTGIYVYNSGVNVLDGSDDEAVLLNSTKGKGGLHSLSIYSIAKDLDGEIWVGTDDGITVFYCPYFVFDGGCDATRPILEKEDGTGDYLMTNQTIISIAVDGANRKWVGTTNGLFLLSPDGRSTIHSFTTSNSPLLSNFINSVDVDEVTGKVYISTSNGLNVYQSDAQMGANGFENVVVYPNPLRHQFEGPVAIKGLTRNADVRITDVSGNLVHRTTALGGQAIWDAKNASGSRVATGVYLIWCTNEDATDAYVTKVFIVN